MVEIVASFIQVIVATDVEPRFVNRKRDDLLPLSLDAIEQGRHIAELVLRNQVEGRRAENIDAGRDHRAVHRLFADRLDLVAVDVNHAVWHLKAVFPHTEGRRGSLLFVKLEHLAQVAVGEQIAVHDHKRFADRAGQLGQSTCGAKRLSLF